MVDGKKGHPLTRAVAFFVVTVTVTALLALQGWLHWVLLGVWAQLYELLTPAQK